MVLARSCSTILEYRERGRDSKEMGSQQGRVDEELEATMEGGRKSKETEEVDRWGRTNVKNGRFLSPCWALSSSVEGVQRVIISKLPIP